MINFNAGRGETADFEIVTADGRHQHIIFEPKDLRWYLDHRGALPSADR